MTWIAEERTAAAGSSALELGRALRPAAGLSAVAPCTYAQQVIADATAMFHKVWDVRPLALRGGDG